LSITLTNGHIQGANIQLIMPLGWMELTLNVDATIIAPPFGQVLAGVTDVVYFDTSSNVITTGGNNVIWSNLELNPQLSPVLLGTWYIVNFYNSNGARLNIQPQTWQFTVPNGTVVDISSMTAINVGGIVYYPSVLNGGGIDQTVNLTITGGISMTVGQNLLAICSNTTTQTLPAAASVPGQTCKLVKGDGGVTVTTVAGLISGNYFLTAQYQYVLCESNGVNWYVVGNN
jgi:hypothetical protein